MRVLFRSRPPTRPLHRRDELAHALHLGGLGFVELQAEPALELQGERDPLEGVDAEVELQAGLQVEGPVGIAQTGSERVGKECCGRCRSRWSPDNEKKTKRSRTTNAH